MCYVLNKKTGLKTFRNIWTLTKTKQYKIIDRFRIPRVEKKRKETNSVEKKKTVKMPNPLFEITYSFVCCYNCHCCDCCSYWPFKYPTIYQHYNYKIYTNHNNKRAHSLYSFSIRLYCFNTSWDSDFYLLIRIINWML